MNLPFICSNILVKHAYGVEISQLISYSITRFAKINRNCLPFRSTWGQPHFFIRGSCWSIFSLWVVSEYTLVFNITWTFMLINCRGQSSICLFHVKHNLDFSTNYPCPSITHGKITVEQKLKLSVLLTKEDSQFGKHNRSSVWVSIFC